MRGHNCFPIAANCNWQTARNSF